jgi:dienelactone hydrolase
MTRLLRALACALFIVPAAAQSDSGVAVHDNGLVATWYAPARKGPVVVALGGSECGEKGGRLLASSLAREGFGALAVAYCGADGLPQAVQNIPLEYFSKAIDWVEQQPLADRNHIGIYGISIGAETALLVASRDKRIKAVVAGSPSSVVWQGFDMRHFGSVEPTYTFDGKPVPYVPYDMSKPFTSVFDLYQRSLATVADHQDAIIAAENINGPVLLISGKADTLWPSSVMADQVMARLDANHFRFAHAHVAYDDAGHVAPVPPQEHLTLAMLNSLGGTEDGNTTARAEAWKRTLAFFKKYLGDPR